MTATRLEPLTEPLVRLSDVTCQVRRSAAGSERHIPLHEFVFVRRGVFRTHLRRQVLTADPNHALLLNGESVVRFSHPTEEGDRFTAIELYPAAARELAGRYRSRAGERLAVDLPDGTHAASGRMALQLQRLRVTMREGDELGQEELALELAGDMLAQRYAGLGVPLRGERESAHRRQDLVEEVKLLLATRIGEGLSLRAIARAVGRSPFHLARTFRRQAGQPIHRYRLALRLAVALDRVAQGETNLSALAFELGFSSHSHFTRLFRQRYGEPPGRVRGWLGRAAVRPGD